MGATLRDGVCGEDRSLRLALYGDIESLARSSSLLSSNNKVTTSPLPHVPKMMDHVTSELVHNREPNKVLSWLSGHKHLL